MPDAPKLSHVFLTSIIETFRRQKRLAERAVEQIPDKFLHTPLDENTNSLAVIMKHVAGNLRSRWTDFLTSDGEKNWRKRDTEFVDDFKDRVALMAFWDEGWSCLFDALAALKPDDLVREIEIRGEPHTVVRAIHRALDHGAYHTGQIVQLARFLAKDDWTVLSVPKGRSEEYNRRTWKK